jgi:hypothetical protein
MVASIEYVEIDNATYLIDTLTGYTRDDAKIMCENLNMTMVTFEDADQQKWSSINSWLNFNGKTSKLAHSETQFSAFTKKSHSKIKN